MQSLTKEIQNIKYGQKSLTDLPCPGPRLSQMNLDFFLFLQIGNNPINMEGCYELIKAAAAKNCKILHLGLDVRDFSTTVV